MAIALQPFETNVSAAFFIVFRFLTLPVEIPELSTKNLKKKDVIMIL